MFATLVVALLSEHTGGDVVVSHQAEQKTLRTEELTNCDCGYLTSTPPVVQLVGFEA